MIAAFGSEDVVDPGKMMKEAVFEDARVVFSVEMKKETIAPRDLVIGMLKACIHCIYTPPPLLSRARKREIVHTNTAHERSRETCQ